MSATVTTTEASGGGFIRFWTTIPGILTALAALVTAATGYLTLDGRSGSDEPAQPSTTASTLPPTDTGVPSGPLTVQPADFNLARLDALPEPALDPIQEAIAACGDGDMDACVAILDGLADECEAGMGLSCDLLNELSPAGSDYELYGATCGARFEPDVAGTCSSA